MDWGTVLAALIGAGIGSMGTSVVEARLAARAGRATAAAQLKEQYLHQLQSDVESLWYRIENLTRRGGRTVMSDEYFLRTTLFALGAVLGDKQLLQLEGVYGRMESLQSGSGHTLSEHLEAIDRSLEAGRTEFYRYDRVLLGETALVRDANNWRRATYSEFLERYRERETVGTFRTAVTYLSDLADAQHLLTSLEQTGKW